MHNELAELFVLQSPALQHPLRNIKGTISHPPETRLLLGQSGMGGPRLH
jgi:hypothetical protein